MSTKESAKLACVNESGSEIDIFSKVQKNMDLLFAIDRNEQIDILPPIKEIYFVLKNNLISKKDLIMCKLVIDAHLAIF